MDGTATSERTDASAGETPTSRQLAARAGELNGVIAAVTAELVALIAQVLEHGSWRGVGFRSPEHWVTVRCGVSNAQAARLVAMARGLTDLPATQAAFAAGAITADHVAAIVRADIHPDCDEQAARLARKMTVPQLTKALRAVPHPEPAPDPDASGGDNVPEPPTRPGPARRRRARWGHDHRDGTWWLTARGLSPEEGALIEKALRAGRDAEFRDGNDTVTNADGLVRVAQTALDALDPATASGRPPAERYQVHLHVRADDLRSELHLGPELPDAVRDQLTCDGMIRAWVHGPDGTINAGRRARIVDTKLRLAVERRDGGCPVPGCGAIHNLHIHHIAHWRHGGRTDTDNLISPCGRHHRMIHTGELVVAGNPDADDLVFTDRHGRSIDATPPTPVGDRPATAAAAAAGVTPTGTTRRSGEQCQWKWLDWRQPRPPAGPDDAAAA